MSKSQLKRIAAQKGESFPSCESCWKCGHEGPHIQKLGAVICGICRVVISTPFDHLGDY